MERQKLAALTRYQLSVRLNSAIYFFESQEGTAVSEQMKAQYNQHLSTLAEINTRMRVALNMVNNAGKGAHDH